MDLSDGFFLVVGILLVFVLPGYTTTKALFPEWRVRGPDAGLRAVEILSLTLVTSVGITVLAGFALLALPGAGFAASWSNPVLEVVLAVITVAALLGGLVRGAYGGNPPPARELEPSPGSDDGWPIVERLHSLDRERRRVLHAMRTRPGSAEEATRQRAVLEQLDREAETLRRQREAEYGS